MDFGEGKRTATKWRWRFWLGIGLAGAVILFTLQNVGAVEVVFLLWALRLPLAILLFVIFAAGAVSGWLFSRARGRH